MNIIRDGMFVILLEITCLRFVMVSVSEILWERCADI